MAYYHSKYAPPRKKRRNKFRKFLFWFLFIVIVAAAGAGYYVYTIIFNPNVWTPEEKPVSIYIPTGSDFEDVKTILYENGLIIQRKNFEWWAEQKKYANRVMPGHYIINYGISNEQLINLLRSGDQTPVNVTFNNLRNVYQLAGVVGNQIEADSLSLVETIRAASLMQTSGLDSANIKTLFIPNTYEFYWNTSAEGFVKKMVDEHTSFWNDSRKRKAEHLEMTPAEVVTLASIVEKETNKNDEKEAIAGVYINRINSGWRLQADPTVVYAIGDFDIRRVLNKHKKFESPYNTYLHLGLPPGPICIPSIASVDAVLNYEDHNFMFFCARDDLSGYHVFAKTNAEHRRNARRYQEALDEMRIYK
jgi:UPF0755 protein